MLIKSLNEMFTFSEPSENFQANTSGNFNARSAMEKSPPRARSGLGALGPGVLNQFSGKSLINSAPLRKLAIKRVTLWHIFTTN